MNFYKIICFVAVVSYFQNTSANAAPVTHGMVGVGTWKTQAEFKDIQIVKDGQTLFASDFSKGLDGWNLKRGKWEVADGVLRQTSGDENTAAFVGDPNWENITLSVKARKIAGSEGFLLYFQAPDANSVTRWNIGGWNNTKHAFEVPGIAVAQMTGAVETGRWYDIRVEMQGDLIKGYLDEALVQQTTRTAPLSTPIEGRRWGNGAIGRNGAMAAMGLTLPQFCPPITPTWTAFASGATITRFLRPCSFRPAW